MEKPGAECEVRQLDVQHGMEIEVEAVGRRQPHDVNVVGAET